MVHAQNYQMVATNAIVFLGSQERIVDKVHYRFEYYFMVSSVFCIVYTKVTAGIVFYFLSN